MAFLLWAMLPQTKGAKFLYDSFLKDFLKKNEHKIDSALNEARQSVTTIGKEVAQATADVGAAGLTAASEYAKKSSKSDWVTHVLLFVHVSTYYYYYYYYDLHDTQE